jgi:hypothetical protein
MKLNLYNHLKLATEISEAMDTNSATPLERRSLDAILDLLSIIRKLQENNHEINKQASSSVNYTGDFYSPTLGYGRTNYK